jgi:hypothetical protein
MEPLSETYAPILTPTYRPGDDVILCDPAQGHERVRARVRRIVPIAPLSDSTVRYLYMVDLDDEMVPVLVGEDEALRPTW